MPTVPDTPHPAVARIIVPEDGATAYGSGTLVDVREQFGLVITNWHVVRDSQGTVEVVFPSGFRSHARPLKVDSDWDLAALVIWRPPIEPVRVSASRRGPATCSRFTATARDNTASPPAAAPAYYAPKLNFPREMVELDVEARQGDSGGPIFNQRGELAGVLFGAGEGTTIGSFAPRVESFLATLAPDIGSAHDQAQVAVADRPAPDVHPVDERIDATCVDRASRSQTSRILAQLAVESAATKRPTRQHAASEPVAWDDVARSRWYDGVKSALALVGLARVALQLIRFVKSR